MSPEDRELLTSRLAERYAERPDLLERSVRRHVALCFVLLLLPAMLVCLLGVAAISFGVTMPLPGSVFLIGIGTALLLPGLYRGGSLLSFRVADPDGVLLKNGQAAELGRLLGMIRREMGTPEINEIRFDADFNASAGTQLKWGLFGRSRCTLKIGMPLMMSLRPDEFAAVLAHECAHFSSRDGSLRSGTSVLHGVLMMFQQQLAAAPSSWFAALTRRVTQTLIARAMPQAEVRMNLLFRQREFSADRHAAEIAGSDACLSALWRIECYGRHHSEILHELFERSSQEPEPPEQLCELIRNRIAEADTHPHAAAWSRTARSRLIDSDDSHPSLADRMRAVAADPEFELPHSFPEPVSPNAAEILLGTDYPSIVSAVDEQWHRDLTLEWRSNYRRAAAVRRFTERAEASPEDLPDDPAELWNQARRLVEVRGIHAAESLLRALLIVRPDHEGGNCLLGQILAQRGDPDAEPLLSRFLESPSRRWTEAAAVALEQFCRQAGRGADARRIRKKLAEFRTMIEAADKERSAVSARDTLLPHELSDSQVDHVKAALTISDDITDAAIARKKVEYLRDEPMFVLAIDCRHGASSIRETRNRKQAGRLVLDADVPGRLFIVTPTGEYARAAARLLRLEQHRILSTP